MKKLLVFSLIGLFLISFVSAENWAYNYLDSGQDIQTGGNYSINVNNTEHLQGYTPQQVANLYNEMDSLSLHLNQDNFYDDGCIVYDEVNKNFTINWECWASVYYNATTSQLVKGILDGGTLQLTQHPNADYDGITLNFSEASGSPALDLRVNFSDVGGFNRGVMRYKTSDLSGDYPTRQLWNYEKNTWEDYPILAESKDSFVAVTEPIFDNADHIKNGIIQMRLYKASNGNTQNHYYVDWIAMVDGFGTPSGEEVDPFSWHKNTIDSNNYTTTGIINATSFWGSKTITITNTIIGNGTIGSLVESHPDYWIFFVSSNIPANAGDGIYYIRITNGTGEGLEQKISNLVDSAPSGYDATLTMPDGSLFNSLSAGDSFNIYLQSSTDDNLYKMVVDGTVSFTNLLFGVLHNTLKVIVPTGSTTKSPDDLIYLSGANGADYTSSKSIANGGNITIIIPSGGGYAYDAGDGGWIFVDGGYGGTPAYNGGDASKIWWLLQQGGAGTTNGEDGVFRIGTLTNFVEFTYAGITKMKDLLLSGDLKIEDNNKIYLGDSDDSSIYYDSNNLHVNPAELGDGQFVLDGDGYYLYDSYRWKSYQGGYRSNSNPVSSFESASYAYGALLPNGLTKYDITNYIIPDDARANGTIQLMLDFIGNESVMTGNEIIRISQRVGGMTKNEGGQYIMPTVYRNINLSKYNYQNDKWMHINTNNLTNINPGDYFSVLTYRYGADSNDNYNGSIYTPYVWRIKYQSEIA